MLMFLKLVMSPSFLLKILSLLFSDPHTSNSIISLSWWPQNLYIRPALLASLRHTYPIVLVSKILCLIYIILCLTFNMSQIHFLLSLKFSRFQFSLLLENGTIIYSATQTGQWVIIFASLSFSSFATEQHKGIYWRIHWIISPLLLEIIT